MPRRVVADGADRRAAAANEITSRTTATAAAPARSPLSIRPKMKTDETCVLYGRLPVMITSEPNSPTAFANASATPERIPGSMFGKTTRRNVCQFDAPSERAASSISRSSSSSTGCTVRTTNGSVTKSIASTIDACVKATC